jgi:hypothetical protein
MGKSIMSTLLAAINELRSRMGIGLKHRDSGTQKPLSNDKTKTEIVISGLSPIEARTLTALVASAGHNIGCDEAANDFRFHITKLTDDSRDRTLAIVAANRVIDKIAGEMRQVNTATAGMSTSLIKQQWQTGMELARAIETIPGSKPYLNMQRQGVTGDLQVRLEVINAPPALAEEIRSKNSEALMANSGTEGHADIIIDLSDAVAVRAVEGVVQARLRAAGRHTGRSV